MTDNRIRITETPRDGWQAIGPFIPTAEKVAYLRRLLQAGFHTVEVGSLVSPRAIPQMADTPRVLDQLAGENTKSHIAVLVAGMDGGRQVVTYPLVDRVFFPYSVSPTFLRKNIRQSTEGARRTVHRLQELCLQSGKELVVYLSMAFGNPYGDAWSQELLTDEVAKFYEDGLRFFPLSDITGDATPDHIHRVFEELIRTFPEAEFGLHLHSLKEEAGDKVLAAYHAGIRHFDTVMGGLGGCPMTGKELVGNLALESLLEVCEANGIRHGLDLAVLEEASRIRP